MTLQTTRLSVWFGSQLRQKRKEWLQTRQLNLFNLFGFTRREPLRVFNKSGRAVILNTTSLEDDEDNNITLNVDLTIENNYWLKYDPNKDVIIRNYSSSLTFSEINNMITVQKNVNNDKNKLRDVVIGQTFAGIIESIPNKLLSEKKNEKSFPYEIGDRVWGISPYKFGHCWSDYISVPYKNISHAPINIPLHFCGLYPLQLHTLQKLLKYAKININELRNKSVLFIGTGRRSLLSIAAAFFKHLDENNNIIIIDYNKHCRLNNNIMTNYLNINKYYGLESVECVDDYDENSSNELFNNKYMIELNNKYNESFDIVFDSLSMDKNDILENCKMVKPKGTYFWRQSHMAQFDDSIDISKWRIALQGARFLHDIDRDIKKQYKGIKFVPNIDKTAIENINLNSFTSYLTEMSFPIIIDKMYDLNDIQSAFNYTFNNDDSMLGENIGILIEKEHGYEDNMFFEQSVRPKICQIPSIDNLNNKKIKSNNRNADCIDIDDIIEKKSSLNSNVKSNNYGYVQDKTQIVESQTIAKNTSNKS